jgi:dihydrodiol dehydrogenase / D-xylose 1-dehydrogenase (NADP)
MNKTIKWGILGCGKIASKFAEGLKAIPEAELEAVASKTPGKARSFGKKFDVKNIYDNYSDLVNNPSVDVVYIATTHNFHFQNASLCLSNSKPVLCEKPITLNAKQAEELINLAREKKIFLMEAMWTRFLPCILELNELINQGIVGEIQHVTADFGINREFDPKVRAFNPELGGGALLDLGIYTINFARMIYKEPPLKMQSSAFIGTTKIDEKSCYLFEYKNGQTAMLSSSYRLHMTDKAFIFGSKGYLEIPDFYHPIKIILSLEEKPKKTFRLPYKSTGYNYEAKEVMKCLISGQIESKIMPLDETLEIMKTMDILRSQWNFKYPEE